MSVIRLHLAPTNKADQGFLFNKHSFVRSTLARPHAYTHKHTVERTLQQMPKSPKELQKMVGVLRDDSEDLFDIRKSSADPYVPKKISNSRNELVLLTLCFRENKAPGAK